MLSSGTRTASSASACLKCQLRHILTGLTQRPAAASLYATRCRQLSTTPCSRQEHAVDHEEEDVRPRKERSHFYRHINPNGRIVGKPGRRQHQKSEALRATSLGKPSEVIVMRDVDEASKVSSHLRFNSVQPPAEGKKARGALLSAEELEAAVTRHRKAPEQDDVNKSIDQLRPQSSVLDEKEFRALAKKLLDGYNMQQLLRYLVHGLSAASAPTTTGSDSLEHIRYQTTRWQPGRTPLDQRIGLVLMKKNDVANTKAKLADQILRNAWSLTLQIEEQRIGELEVRLKPWQLALLFDRTSPQGRPVFESLIDSPLLVRTTEVRPSRPDCVMRVTARRRDAEEVARRLGDKLSQVGRLEFDLNIFKSLLHKNRALELMLSEDDLRQVAQRTDSVIERQEDGVLAIYSLRDDSRSHARRLLLSLLVLPAPKTTEHIVLSSNAAGRPEVKRASAAYSEANDLVLSEYPALNLHRRLKNGTLYRLVAPVARQEDSRNHIPSSPKDKAVSESTRWRRVTRTLTARLDGEPLMIKPRTSLLRVNDENASMTRIKRDTETPQKPEPQWSAKFCALFRTINEEDPEVSLRSQQSYARKADQKQAAVKSPRLIHSNIVPGLAELLSYFELAKPDSPPTSDDAFSPSTTTSTPTPPLLVAHLIPSPFSKAGVQSLKQLPRMTMTFQLPTTADAAPRLHTMEATLNERELAVPFPDQAVDLVFAKALTFRLKIAQHGTDTRFRKQVFMWGEDASRFEAAVQRSYASGSGALDGLPEMKLRLPSWFKTESAADWHEMFANEERSERKEPVVVDYMLERFEQIQCLDFVPRADWRDAAVDPEMEEVLSQWPAGMTLRCRDVEAGAFAGRRTELSVMDAAAAGAEGTALPLTKTALGLLRLVTMANTGMLKRFADVPRAGGMDEFLG